MAVDTRDAGDPAGAAGPEGAVAPGRGFEMLDLITHDLPVVRLESGQVLFSEGDPAESMFVVKAGKLRIRSGSVVYEDVGPGGIVGEMGLVEGHQPRSAMVYALIDSELIEIDDDRFEALVAQTPRFALSVMQVLSRRLRVMDRRYRPDPRA